MNETKAGIYAALITGAVFLILFLVVWVVGSCFEASAYNNVTGKNISTWDAMWIELRVQEGAK